MRERVLVRQQVAGEIRVIRLAAALLLGPFARQLTRLRQVALELGDVARAVRETHAIVGQYLRSRGGKDVALQLRAGFVPSERDVLDS